MSCNRGYRRAIGRRFTATALLVVCTACGAGGTGAAGARAANEAVVAEGRAAGGRSGEGSGRSERRVAARNELVRGEIVPLLAEGDVVFRRGGGVLSRAVLAADRDGVYSHVGVVALAEGAFVVVHAVPGRGSGGAKDAARIDGPEEFFSPANAARGAVMRLRREVENKNGARTARGATETDGAATTARTEDTGRRAARAALRLARGGILFDHSYDLADTARMYCTELVWHVFRGAGVDLSGGRRTRLDLPGRGGDYIMPSDILSSPELEQVCAF